MVHRLFIKNYKSVKAIDIPVKRVNIFIGEYNSGKSNILEALSWFSVNALEPDVFNQIFRFKNVSNFFFDFDGTQMIEVKTDEVTLKIRYAKNNQGALLNYFEGIIYKTSQVIIDENNWANIREGVINFRLDIPNNTVQGVVANADSVFRTYSFKRLQKFEINFRPYLNPPFGDNVVSILQSNREWKQLVSDFFKDKGFRLNTKPVENEIEIVKDVDGELYSFPYATISETMQRFVFLLLALESNKDATLILDEPESNMFPFFIKDFAERIARNDSNQYFIATHDPYLLSSLLEKTPLADIAVFITRMENYQTIVEECDNEQISEMISLGSGIFFNLNNIRK